MSMNVLLANAMVRFIQPVFSPRPDECLSALESYYSYGSTMTPLLGCVP